MLSVDEVDLEVDVDILELLDLARLREVAIDIKEDDTEPLPEAHLISGSNKIRIYKAHLC
jgi:hypothetical protein